MWSPKNWATVDSPDGGHAEIDAFTCGHCQRQVFVPVGKSAFDLGGGCRICENLICPKCVDLGVCRPWEEQMRAIENKAATDQMVSRLVGR